MKSSCLLPCCALWLAIAGCVDDPEVDPESAIDHEVGFAPLPTESGALSGDQTPATLDDGSPAPRPGPSLEELLADAEWVARGRGANARSSAFITVRGAIPDGFDAVVPWADASETLIIVPRGAAMPVIVPIASSEGDPGLWAHELAAVLR